ncbi:MAG TPA: sugar ABC transporter permease [Candidatus Treponema faecavium]|nr:sugar ABC transporter permease [Candidatus Treponema faecavium]
MRTALKEDRMKRKLDGAAKRFIAVCTIPTFILYFIFVVYPIFNMLGLSFVEWNGLLGAKTFVGFENYRILFQDDNFWKAFQNTIFLIVVVTSVTFVLALLFASILAKGHLKGQAFFRILFYIPNILSIVVISAIFYMFYSSDYGILGPIYNAFGKQYTGVLGDPDQVVWAIAVAMIWQAIGYYMVMYIAGMDSIPDELYESAGLDGASKVQQFFVITLPMTWQVIRVTLTFFIISTINMSFLFVTAMTNGAPDGASNVLLVYMSSQRANGSFGYAMAIGTVLFIFAYGLALIVNKLTERDPLN